MVQRRRQKEHNILPQFRKTAFKTETIKSLHLSDNEVVNTDEEILKETSAFYQKVYCSTVSSIDNQCEEIFFPPGNESETSVDAS